MVESFRTRNYVGTIFGGSLYAAVDNEGVVHAEVQKVIHISLRKAS